MPTAPYQAMGNDMGQKRFPMGNASTNYAQDVPLDPSQDPTPPAPPAAPAGTPPQDQGPGPGNAPAPIQQFGATPNITPTYQNTATMDPTFASASLVNPYNQFGAYNQYTGLLGASLQPQFQQQQQQLDQDLRARGIANSGAASYDMGNLLTQQSATLAGAYAPFVQQMYGYQQQDTQSNQGALNQFALANQGVANTAATNNMNALNTGNAANANIANEASLWNAEQYAGDRTQNYNAYNAYENEMLGFGANEQNALLSAWLNSFGPQTGVTNALNTAVGSVGSAAGNAFTGAEQAGASSLGALASGYGAYAGLAAAGAGA